MMYNECTGGVSVLLLGEDTMDNHNMSERSNNIEQQHDYNIILVKQEWQQFD
jgi:hypothetical protein